jgi:hypothetical protein
MHHTPRHPTTQLTYPPVPKPLTERSTCRTAAFKQRSAATLTVLSSARCTDEATYPDPATVSRHNHLAPKPSSSAQQVAQPLSKILTDCTFLHMVPDKVTPSRSLHSLQGSSKPSGSHQPRKLAIWAAPQPASSQPPRACLTPSPLIYTPHHQLKQQTPTQVPLITPVTHQVQPTQRAKNILSSPNA